MKEYTLLMLAHMLGLLFSTAVPCKTEEQKHTVCFDSCRDLCGSDVFNAAAVLFECILYMRLLPVP